MRTWRLALVLPLGLAGCATLPPAEQASDEAEALNHCVYVAKDESGGAFQAFKGEEGDNVWEIASLRDTSDCDVLVTLKQEAAGSSAVAVSAYSHDRLADASAADQPDDPAPAQVGRSLLGALAPGTELYRQVSGQRDEYRAGHPEQPQPAATAASGGFSKEELQSIVKQAVAEAKSDTAAPASSTAKQLASDVDEPGYALKPDDKRFALVVGVESYSDLPPAAFAQRDAEAVSRHLLAMGWPQRNIVLLTNERATRVGLAKNLESWLARVAGPDSAVFFYFAGHGAPDPRSGQAFLIPWDGDPQYLDESAYPVNRLFQKLGSLKARSVVAVLDSCFSGAGGRSQLAHGARPLVNRVDLGPSPRRVVSFMASAGDQITGSLDEQGHGLFTYYFLKGLAQKNGQATAQELYDFLVPAVQDEARRQHREQTPQLRGSPLDAGLR